MTRTTSLLEDCITATLDLQPSSVRDQIDTAMNDWGAGIVVGLTTSGETSERVIACTINGRMVFAANVIDLRPEENG